MSEHQLIVLTYPSMLLRFRIQLAHIKKPPVWRQLAVPADFNFYCFHKIIQVAFGWKDKHLYQFSAQGYRSDDIISVPHPETDYFPVTDSRKVKLKDIFHTEGQKHVYMYDLGDDWTHNILLEKITDEKVPHARLITGKGMCPPEDCGGPWEYEHIKEVMASPGHEEYETVKSWWDREQHTLFDPSFFDLEAVQQSVSQV